MDILTLAEIGCAVVTGASAVCAMTPTPSPSTTLGKVYRSVEALGLLIGKAKDTGLVPANPVVDAVEKSVVAVAADALGKTAPALLLAAMLVSGLSACAGGGPTPAVPQAVGALTTALAATPTGQAVLAKIKAVQAGAASAVQKANAGIGLSPTEVAGLCALDQALHPVVNGLASAVPGGSLGDDAAYAAAQTACNLEAGQSPSASQLAPLVQEAASVLGAL